MDEVDTWIVRLLTAAGGTLSRGKLHLFGWVTGYFKLIPMPEGLEWSNSVKCEELDWRLATLTNDYVLEAQVHEIDEEHAYMTFTTTLLEGEEEEWAKQFLEPEHHSLRALGRATWSMVHTPKADPWKYAAKYKPPEEDMPPMLERHIEEAKVMLDTLNTDMVD